MLYVIFHVVYYGTYTLIQEINYAQLNDIINNLTDFSYHDNFVSVIGDLNITIQIVIETLMKLMDIYVVQYVDDSTKIIACTNSSDLQKYINIYFSILEEFYNINKLLINSDKSKLLIITKPAQRYLSNNI